METTKIEVDEKELIQATEDIVDFCQEKDIPELVAYMAMISIVKAMEEKLGFSHQERSQ